MPSETSKPNAPAAFSVVVVPFPYSDVPRTKKRPALVLSDADRFNAPAGHTVLAMITSAKATEWPLDVPLGNPRVAGLPRDCVVRMKLFTLDNRLIIRSLGQLSETDQKRVLRSVKELMPC